MKKFFYIFFIFFLLSLSKPFTDKIRYLAISSISSLKNLKKEDQKNFKLENELLKIQEEGFYQWLMFDQRIDKEVTKLKKLSEASYDEIYWKEFFIRRAEEIKNILKIQLQTLPAKIVFRDPSSWSSSIWINIGKNNNRSLERDVIGKNSPVIVDDFLIGIVEYVGERFSRVRLITDSGFIPSVRAIRGKKQNEDLKKTIISLFHILKIRDDLFKEEEKREFCLMLSKILSKIDENKYEYFLAKGEIRGSSRPLWRSFGQKLKGIGFNYSYPDAEGPARDLITGEVVDKNLNFLSKELLKKGDLLVTTGMDGVFPPGLKVGYISKVEDLKEGDFFYSIEAIPISLNLEDLKLVFVLPPCGFEKE